jgi:hypothetical protein
MPKYFFQDGEHFFDEKENEIVFSYPGYVKNDNDIEGAKRARAQFLLDFPEYKQYAGKTFMQ